MNDKDNFGGMDIAEWTVVLFLAISVALCVWAWVELAAACK